MRKVFALLLALSLFAIGCGKEVQTDSCQVTCNKDLNGGCTCGTCICECCDPTEIE